MKSMQWTPTLVATVLLCVSLFAESYHVDQATGSDRFDGLAPATAWKTIGKANGAVSPGDSVYIHAGVYAESIRPGRSGEVNNRISYCRFEHDEVILRGVGTAIDIDTRSYITVHGIEVREVSVYLLLDSCRHVWIEACRFDSATSTGGWPVGVRLRDNARYNRIAGCTIGRVGYSTSDDDKGGVMNLGTWSDTADHSDYNLLENNTFFYGGHHVIEVSSSHNVFRNNYFHNEGWMSCSRPGGLCGNRLMIFGYDPNQVAWNIVEGNRFAFSGLPPDQNTSAGISIRTPRTIVRRNVFYHNDGYGLGLSTSNPAYNAEHNYIYHNTFYHNGYTMLSGVESWKQVGLLVAKHGDGIPVEHLSVVNNIFHDNNAGGIRFYYVPSAGFELKGNREGGDPGFVDVTSAVFPTDPSRPDLRLTQASHCIDAGVFLTTIASESGTGTSFAVADAGYFTDGMGVIGGDTIQVRDRTPRAAIVAIDYADNRLTVDRELSWSTGDGVSLAFRGDAPDIGAFETAATTLERRPAARPAIRTSGLTMRRGVEGFLLAAPAAGTVSIGVYSLAGRRIGHGRMVVDEGTSRRVAPEHLGLHRGVNQICVVVVELAGERVARRFAVPATVRGRGRCP
jgi:hypothetical protein